MSEDFSDLSEALIEWVYDQVDGQPFGRSSVDLGPFAQVHGLDARQSLALLRYCRERGLLDDRENSLSGAMAHLTPEGAKWMRERRDHRSDPILRAVETRRMLLKWLSKKKYDGAQMPVVQNVLKEQPMFLGVPFTPDEIDRASEHLYRKGLTRGVTAWGARGPIRAETTPDGDDCVEQYGGDVSEYERRRDHAATVISVGTNTGNIAANSREFIMSATTSDGMNLADITMFARSLRQAAPVLGLPEQDAEELVGQANRIEQEASTEDPDASRITRWGAGALAVLNSPAVTGALAAVLAAYGKTVLPGLPSGT